MTLYSLARKYNVGMDSILAANPDLNPQAIPLGYPVNIPMYAKAITVVAPLQSEDAIPVYYRVQPKETLYRISRVYLGVPPETLMSLNPRASSQISIGEVLHLGWYRPYENSNSPLSVGTASLVDSTMYNVKDYTTEYKKAGKVIREQKGLAVWKPGNDKTHYFVLHPTAQVGSYMEVTNPMLHRTLTAKVSGNIPPGIYQSHVGLVVSPSVARALGVLDQQFFARWRFVE
jgi:LysM repeat protein